MKKKLKSCIKSLFAVFTVMAVMLSLVLPSPVAKAEGDQQIEKIESFKATLEKGATLTDGKYIWNAKTDSDGHQFVFRVDYDLSGVKSLAPGNIKIRIPKTILKDRKGNSADYADMSIPSDEEYKQATEDVSDVNYTWKYSEDGKYIEITNVTERNAGENGYIDVAYVTNKKTFEYQDMGKSDPFKADITVTNGEQTVTASSDAVPVYINTTAEISSTEKKTPSKIYRTWQSSWGTQPEKTKGKYFLVWQIVSKIKKDPTQPYTFTIEDTPQSEELKLIGYSMGNENGPFTDTNKVINQQSDSNRYDYVLTYYDPAKFTGKDYYELKNSVKATVTPEDGIDAPTSANSSKQWEWDTPKFVRPTGHFYGLKFGDNSWKDGFGYYHDYSSYSLDKFQEKKTDSIDTFRYFTSVYGFALPWTRDGDADDPASYGKNNVTYQLTDDELYLDDKIASEDTGNEQLNYKIPDGAHQLDSKDYQFLYADWSIKSQFVKFDNEEQKFVKNKEGKYSSSDIVHFWAKTGNSNKYKEVATYNLGTKTAAISDDSIVSSLNGSKISFSESANVTGIRFTESNAYYYTDLSAYPMVKLKNSDYVMNTVKGKKLIRLHNFSQSDVFDSNGDGIFGLRCYAFDRAVKPVKESEIHKHIVSTGSSRLKKTYTVRWLITQKETLTTDEGTEYMVQNSGTFYDLLPSGMHFSKGSVEIKTESGYLPSSSYTVSVESNYRGSGREMVKVSVPVQAKYYSFYLSATMDWDSIKDFGEKINNPCAYETGNEDIHNGYSDSGGTLSAVNKTYMTGLDTECKTNRFIYDEEPHEITEITAAVSGLKKQVRDENDSRWLYETSTTPKGNYAYRIRFSNTTTDKAKNLIFFDSLENYNLNNKKSDWHGTLKSFDVSQLKQKGIAPVIYVSTQENLSIDDHHDLTDASVWQKYTDDTDLTKVHAFAVDCRKTSDGNDFILNEGESVTATVNMQAPSSVAKASGDYAKAYNNIYIQDTVMSKDSSSDYFIHQDYTELKYRIAAPLKIHKQSSEDENTAIGGAKYSLTGTSDYGTEINQNVTTGYNGNAVFDNIEKGSYILKEISSPNDWQLNHHEYNVKIDNDGKVSVDGENISDRAILKDSPRIHGDISFMKYSTVSNKAISGAKFRLSGTSKYGNDVMEYAKSDKNGKVKFSNIEYGTYKLKEVEAPDGYILSDNTYTASVSESGNSGISDAEMLSTGSAVIRNEPYHSVRISKQSSYDDSVISGAEFSLSGVSDYGHNYTSTAVSGSNGIAEFDNLEAGKYTLEETKAPEGYETSTSKHIVTVQKNGKYTITNLDKNDSGIYRVDNRPKENGRITVKKIWKDDRTNDQRPNPVIHLSTDINKMPSYAEWKRNAVFDKNQFNEDVTNSGERSITEVKYSNISADEIPSDAERMDKNYNDPNAVYKIYAWKKDNIAYYWTNAQTTKLTDTSNTIFRNLRFATSIDLSHVITTGMTNMSKLFYGDNNITEIDLSTFDTSAVTNMALMFYACKKLTSLDLSNFDTSNVANMNGMFGVCENLETLNLLSFDTSKVISMAYMFVDCGAIETLDLSHFDTKSLTAADGIFDFFTEKLKDIYVSDRWNLNKVIDDSYYRENGYLKYKEYKDINSSETSENQSASDKTESSDTADYVSTDKSHCSVTKDGDTWTYEFKVADENAKYYLWEDDMIGYEETYTTYASKRQSGNCYKYV